MLENLDPPGDALYPELRANLEKNKAQSALVFAKNANFRFQMHPPVFCQYYALNFSDQVQEVPRLCFAHLN